MSPAERSIPRQAPQRTASAPSAPRPRDRSQTPTQRDGQAAVQAGALATRGRRDVPRAHWTSRSTGPLSSRTTSSDTVAPTARPATTSRGQCAPTYTRVNAISRAAAAGRPAEPSVDEEQADGNRAGDARVVAGEGRVGGPGDQDERVRKESVGTRLSDQVHDPLLHAERHDRRDGREQRVGHGPGIPRPGQPPADDDEPGEDHDPVHRIGSHRGVQPWRAPGEAVDRLEEATAGGHRASLASGR